MSKVFRQRISRADARELMQRLLPDAPCKTGADDTTARSKWTPTQPLSMSESLAAQVSNVGLTCAGKLVRRDDVILFDTKLVVSATGRVLDIDYTASFPILMEYQTAHGKILHRYAPHEFTYLRVMK